jgi:hypothetical protein
MSFMEHIWAWTECIVSPFCFFHVIAIIRGPVCRCHYPKFSINPWLLSAHSQWSPYNSLAPSIRAPLPSGPFAMDVHQPETRRNPAIFNPMKVLIRARASAATIGSGHVMRYLALAKALPTHRRDFRRRTGKASAMADRHPVILDSMLAKSWDLADGRVAHRVAAAMRSMESPRC